MEGAARVARAAAFTNSRRVMGEIVFINDVNGLRGQDTGGGKEVNAREDVGSAGGASGHCRHGSIRACRALSGRRIVWLAEFPGRCPGLMSSAPSGPGDCGLRVTGE